MVFDIVIKNGHVIDGTGNPWFKADVGISDGRIAELSRAPLESSGRLIDAKGLLICPGFINLHSHSDGSILFHNNAENCLSMGLVTELTGQCGSSVAPITGDYKESVRARMKGRFSPIEVDWSTLDEWLRRLEEKGVGINVAPLVGHGTLRACVMGEEGKGGERVTPTDEEMREMKSLLEGGMEDGAFGLSTGLNYAPGRNALTEEVIELTMIVAKYGGVYASHLRCEGEMLIEATKEFIRICETAGVRGTIAHHKASGGSNFGKVCETLRLVEAARAKGVDVIVDQYPWRIGGTIKSLGARFKSFLPEDESGRSPREALVEILKDDAKWGKIKEAALEGVRKEQELYEARRKEMQERGGWTSIPYAFQQEGTILSSKSHPELEWKTLQEVAKFFDVDDVLNGIRTLLVADEGFTVAGGEPYSEFDIVTVLKYPWTTVSTDQYAFDALKVSFQDAADEFSIGHPRGWGTYPKILGKYVRQERVLTLEEAIRKMTSLPALFLGLQDRGIVRKGFWADLVVFNPENVGNIASYGSPMLYPKGIPYVLVNGQLVVDGGTLTGALAGKMLRNKA